MKISAAIFDLDGTVIDSEPFWGKAYLKVLSDLGIKSDDLHPGEAGVAITENWKNLIKKYEIKTSKTPEELRALTYLEYAKFIPEIELNPGVVEFITNLKDSGVEIVLATGSIWETTDKILKKLEIETLFDSITTGDEVVNEKPDPEIFIKAAGKLNLELHDCLVLEDSKSGIDAAKEAGMKVVAIDPGGEVKDLDDADLVVEGFSEITPQVIDQL